MTLAVRATGRYGGGAGPAAPRRRSSRPPSGRSTVFPGPEHRIPGPGALCSRARAHRAREAPMGPIRA